MNAQVSTRSALFAILPLFVLTVFAALPASANSLTDYFKNREGVWSLVSGQFTNLHTDGTIAEKDTVVFHENEVLKVRGRWLDGFETCTSDDLNPDDPPKCRDGGNEWYIQGSTLIFIRDQKKVPVRLIESTAKKLSYFYSLNSMTFYVSEEITRDGVWILNRKTRYRNGSIGIDYLSAIKVARKNGSPGKQNQNQIQDQE